MEIREKAKEAAFEVLELWMRDAKPEERIDTIKKLIGPYCHHCGEKPEHRCYCWNDE